MNARRFVQLLLITAAVLLAYNGALIPLGRTAAPRALMRRMDAEPKIDVLFVGDSTLDSGLNEGAFQAGWREKTREPVRPLNIALRASTGVEQYLLFRHALAHHPEIKTVVIGFWDFKLTQPEQVSWSDLAGNMAMGFYVEPDLAASLYEPGSTVARWKFLLVGKMPMLTERLSVWTSVERRRRAVQEIGMPHEETNEFGRVADFQALAPRSVDAYTQYAEEFVRSSGQLWAPAKAMVEDCRQHGIRVVVVEIPMTPRHQKFFYSTEAWHHYRNYLRSLVEKEGGTYVSAGDWANDQKFFSDTRHLNRSGAILFSERLAASVAPPK